MQSILCIMVMAKNLLNGECTKSKLRLVNLAGSERLAKTDVQGERLKETQNINLSLSALGTVISALAAKSRHIPYRNSKLTHLLEDSLGDDSKALMFLQISPSDKDLDETLSSLNFATRVRGVVLGSGKMQVDTSELQKTKAMLEELEGQIELKTSMQNQSEKQISQLSEKLKGKEETCTTLQHKVKELEKKMKEQLQSETSSFQQQIKELERKLKEQKESSESLLRQQIKELETKLNEQEQRSESSLRQQMNELEKRYSERELQWQQQTHCFVEAGKATPDVGKSRMSGGEYPSESEARILKSSNSVNPPTSQASTNQIRSKREFRGNEAENNYGIPTSLHDRRVTRKSDPPRVARVVRPTTKPVIAAQAAPVSHKRASTSRDQVQGIKERETKKKIWSR